jgi:hypothetical protein
MLESFERRRDFSRHAARLADTGVAGTAIHYPFFADTAAWLAQRFPRQLHVDWSALDDDGEQRILDRLDPLVLYAESPGLDEADLDAAPLDRASQGPAGRRRLPRPALRGPRGGSGAARELLRRGSACRWSCAGARDSLAHARLRPFPRTSPRTGPRTGSPRTRLPAHGTAAWAAGLSVALRRSPRVRELGRAQGERFIALAREAMVTRSRDLDVFVYGDPDDVRLLECEDGLAFAAIGFRPERRLLLEAVYGSSRSRTACPSATC